MKDLRGVNFEAMFRQFFSLTEAPLAMETFWRRRRGELSNEEMSALFYGRSGRRDMPRPSSFIALLKFYSLLEIALLVSFIPEPDDLSIWTDIRESLALPEFRTFYEKDYPLILPEFLLRRLTEGYELREEILGGTSSVFLVFLSLIARTERDDDIAFFLRLAMRADFDQDTMGTLRVALKDKKIFMNRLLDSKTGDEDEVSRALRGLDRFLNFCNDFDGLLGRSPKYPLLQSAMWNYYGDVFQLYGRRIERTVKAVLEGFETWVQEEHWDDYQLDVKKYLSQMFEVIDRLTSDYYGGNLPQVAELPSLVGGSGFAQR